MSRVMKNCCKVLLVCALAFVIVPAMPTSTQTAEASVHLQDGRPDIRPSHENGSGTVVNYAGYSWYVVSHDENGGGGIYPQPNSITLFAKSADFGTTHFDADTNSSQYASSALRTEMEGIASSIQTASPKEYSRINVRTLTAGVNDISGPDVPDQRLWPISVVEWGVYGSFVSTASFSDAYWLRSASDATHVHVGAPDGGTAPPSQLNAGYAVRPALSVNLSSVLFTSQANEDGKGQSVVGLPLVQTDPVQLQNGTIKFTFLDDYHATNNPTGQRMELVATTAQSTQAVSTSEALSFSYQGATIGAGQYISCVLTSTTSTEYYGKLVANAYSASGTLSLPLAGIDDGVYTVKVFSEKINQYLYSDYASTPETFTLTVEDGTATVSNYAGTVVDLPTITTLAPSGNTEEVIGTVVITFSEEMSTLATQHGSVTLEGGGSTIDLSSGSFISDRLFVIGYSGLDYGTTYTVKVAGFSDADGNVMLPDSTHTFTTEGATLPTIISLTPDGAAEELQGTLTITFSTDMDTTAGMEGTLSLSGGGIIGADGRWEDSSTYVISYSGLTFAVPYAITVSGFKDTSGNEMLESDGFGFTTRAADSYTIEINFKPSADSSGATLPSSSVTVSEAHDSEVTFSPGSSYTIIDVAVDGVSQGVISSHTFNNVVADHTVEVTVKSTTPNTPTTPTNPSDNTAPSPASGGGLSRTGDSTPLAFAVAGIVAAVALTLLIVAYRHRRHE